MKRLFILWCTFVSLISGHFAFAQSAEGTADKVFSQFSKLPTPSTSANEFERWTYTTAALTAVHCWQSLKKGSAIPAKLANIKSGATQVWGLPKQNTTISLCQSFADKGVKPVCTHSNLWAKNVKRRTDLPLDYLQVYKNKSLEIEGTLGCYLNADQIDKQSYSGPISATWIEKPVLRTVNLPSGPKMLETGTLMITAPNAIGRDGKEYHEPRLTVVISE